MYRNHLAPRWLNELIHALAYRSRATALLSAEALEHLVGSAARFNKVAGVTGVMLFDGEEFFQYIEGPADGLAVAMGRIETSPSHCQIEVLAQQRVGTRLIPYWSMQVFEENAMDLSLLSSADWSTLLISPPRISIVGTVNVVGEEPVASGVDRLLQLVRRRLLAA